MNTNTDRKIATPSEAWQLGYSDAVRYGMPRNLRDYPRGAMQRDYDIGYADAVRRGKREYHVKDYPQTKGEP
jgi:hypothetical protein